MIITKCLNLFKGTYSQNTKKTIKLKRKFSSDVEFSFEEWKSVWSCIRNWELYWQFYEKSRTVVVGDKNVFECSVHNSDFIRTPAWKIFIHMPYHLNENRLDGVLICNVAIVLFYSLDSWVIRVIIKMLKNTKHFLIFILPSNFLNY